MARLINSKPDYVPRAIHKSLELTIRRFSPVVRYDSMRILLALAAVYDKKIIQFVIKTAFLNGDLDEEVFMEQPKGYISEDPIWFVNYGRVFKVSNNCDDTGSRNLYSF